MKRLLLLALMVPLIVFTSFSPSPQANFDTTDLFLGFRYGMTAAEYLSYLNAIQPSKPMTIMWYPPKCQGVSTPEFSYFGFDFTPSRMEAIYCTPDFDEHCKLVGLTLKFPEVVFTPDQAPEQDWWSKFKGEKSPQQIAYEEAQERKRKYYETLVQKMKSAIESKYGPPNYSGGAYCWFFGHKKITISKDAEITYTYIQQRTSNNRSDL
ncbi:MAG TPA: hypothetical protein VK809_00245 [Bacteroidia bacterium]|jgi:hypothetical protein|nr:hypothetical protein [Bacteroidia bacterium]